MANTIVINGITIASGDNITIRNGKVIVDGKDVTPDAKEIVITITGDVSTLKVDACESIAVQGNAGSVNTMSGDIEVIGNIEGSVQTVSGNVECGGSIGGRVQTVSGEIRSRR